MAGWDALVNSRRFLALGAVLACMNLGACTSTAPLRSETAAFDWSSQQKRLLLVKPDVELGEVTAGGVVEPRADWSDKATRGIEDSLSAALSRRGIQVDALASLSDPREVQLAKLNGVVGGEILIHQMGFSKLPTKTSALDWTLGPGTNAFRTKYRADYAMFVFVRDTYSSDSRKALMFLGMATGGTQIAFASLVDLRTGNIVWFNRLLTTAGGDLRNSSGAGEFTANLLKDSPL